MIRVLFCAIVVSILMACGNSPNSGNSSEEPTSKQPSLENMVYIPEGDFLMGSPEGEGAYDEHPRHKVYLNAYYIDKYEVTNAQFEEFVEATGYVTYAERKGEGWVFWPDTRGPLRLWRWRDANWQHPNTRQDPSTKQYIVGEPPPPIHPVVQVSWNDAQSYCKWAGKRLPTEAEWEKAAKGPDCRKWPWGDVFDANINGETTHANIAGSGIMPFGSFATGVSPYGAYNMGGNVREWVTDWYSPDYYTHSPVKNPKGPDDGRFRVLRGGSWREIKSYQVLSSSRYYKPPDYSSNFIGFRCALDAK